MTITMLSDNTGNDFYMDFSNMLKGLSYKNKQCYHLALQHSFQRPILNKNSPKELLAVPLQKTKTKQNRELLIGLTNKTQGTENFPLLLEPLANKTAPPCLSEKKPHYKTKTAYD